MQQLAEPIFIANITIITENTYNKGSTHIDIHF